MPCLIMCVDVWVYMHGYRQAPGHQLSSLLASPPGKPLFSILPSQRAPNISNISKTFYISLLNCKHIVPAIYVLHIKTKSFFFCFLFLCFLGTKARQKTHGVALKSQEPVLFAMCSTQTPLCRLSSLSRNFP